MRVELFKRVPIVVEVDLHTRKIVRVIVCDESAQDYDWEPNMSAAKCAIRDADGDVSYSWETATAGEHAAAVAIADSDDTEWPAWQFGP